MSLVAIAPSGPVGLYHDPDGEERRFRRILAAVLTAVLVASLIVPYLDVPAPTRLDAADIPTRFAQLLIEARPPLPVPEQEAPPVESVPVPEVIPDPVPEPVVPDAIPEPVPAPAPEPDPPPVAVPEPETPAPPPAEIPEPVVEPPPVGEAEVRAAARQRAASSGLLALRDEIALARSPGLASRLEARELEAVETPAEPAPAPVVIASDAGAGSGGVADRPAHTDPARLAERETTRVEAPAAREAAPAAPVSQARPALPQRSSEEIQRMFERNRPALNTIYSRALRADPTLAGTVVLRLTIAPDGTVTECEVVSSELGDEGLERRLVLRVRQFVFEDRTGELAETITTYPIDFFPG